MKKTIRLLLLLAILSVGNFAGAAPADDPKAAAAFFTETRMNFSQRPDFQGGWSTDPDRDVLLKTYDENKPDDFIVRSGAWLRKCPVDARVHLMRAGLLLKTGDAPGHFYHRMFYYGLMASVASSGDGKSPETAYKVIAVDEEYTFLNHVGAKVKSQILRGGHHDAMAVDWNGKEAVIYFDAAIPMSVMQKQLDAVDKK